MPPLPNVRQERFVQHLFEGKSATESYALAGYKPSQPNSSRMTWNDMVQARLAELQSEAARNSEITVESLLSELETARVQASNLSQLSADVRAVEAKARISGLLVNRTEIGAPVNSPAVKASQTL
jgi:phage terminase small subunit